MQHVSRRVFLATATGTMAAAGGYCAYRGLAHSRIVKVPVNWFYKKQGE